MSKSSVQHLLKKYAIKPDTDRGQHFLIDDAVLAKIASAVQPGSADAVVEVGSGIGNLTALLAAEARHLLAVEIDRSFEPALSALSAVNKNMQVVYDDILKLPFQELQRHAGITEADSYVIAGNIPYYLTARLFSAVLKYPILPRRIVFLVQAEVAERIVAAEPRHTKLSLSVQLYGRPKIVLRVPRSAFMPEPAVDSALLAVEEIGSWSFPEDESLVWQLIRIGFSSKRKKLLNNLSAGLRRSREQVLEQMLSAGIDETMRAEALSADQWRSLARVIS